MAMEKKQRIILMLCVAYGIWDIGTQWTSTLLSFLHWDTSSVMSIVHIGYIQAFGSLCNAFGAFFFGQLIDSTGPKTIFMISAVLTSIYYMGLSFARDFYFFFFLQLLRIGYHFDAAAEMYLATVTTERERTQALMTLNVPHAMALFFGPLLAAKVAIHTTLRTSQFLSGIVTLGALVPTIWWLLPNTHSVPKLASARLRPQEYWPMVTKNGALREAILLRLLIVAPYVSFELIARQFLMRAYFQGPYDTALLLASIGLSLIAAQCFLLPYLQRRHSPRRLLQIALSCLVASYLMANFCRSFHQVIMITALQTAANAIAFAETSTQLTSSVERMDLGKATGLAAMGAWMIHFIMPIYTSHLVITWHYTYAFYSSALISATTLAFVTVGAKYVDARVEVILPAFGMG